MNLKTSFFNSTLFKSNIKRFWWVAAIFFIASLTFGNLPLIDSGDTEGFYVITIMACIIAAILPTILFSYLDFAGSVTCLHAFPIKRKAHFITHITTIYALILVPAVICYMVGALYCSTTDYRTLSNAITISALWKMFVVLITYVTIFASGGILANMVTGNPISAIVFSGLFIGFPYYTEIIFSEFLQKNVYGIPRYTLSFTNLSINEFTPYLTVSFFIWLAIIFISWLLYKNRRLETNGDIISFNFLKPVFIGCVSAFFGLLGYFYLTSLFNLESIFLILPFGLLGVIISNMLAKKAFTIKSAVKPCLIYILGVVVLWAVITFDLSGYENYIPKANDIASVCIANDATKNPPDFAGRRGGVDYYYTDPYNSAELDFTQPEEIEKVQNLHKWLIKNKGNGKDNYTFIPITYTLKDGSTVARLYPVNHTTDKEALAPVYNTKQMHLAKYFIFRDFEKTITSISVKDQRIAGNNKLFNTYAGNSEKGKALLAALSEDAMAADYNTLVNYNSNTLTTIYIAYNRPVETEDAKPADSELFGDEVRIGITASFVKTNALLAEYGLLDTIINPEQISYAEVYFYHLTQGEKTIKITNKEQILQLYKINSSYADITQSTKLSDDNIYGINISFYDEQEQPLYTLDCETTSNLPAFLISAANEWTQTLVDKNQTAS